MVELLDDTSGVTQIKRFEGKQTTPSQVDTVTLDLGLSLIHISEPTRQYS